MPIQFFPLSAILEPTKRFGGGLRHARNLIPAYDGWRSLRKRSVLTRNFDKIRPINGAFQHIYTSTQGLQVVEPALQDVPVDIGDNARFNDDNDGDFDNFPEYVGGTVDDSKFMVVGGGLDTVMNIPLQNGSDGVEQPSSTSNWKLRVRYKVEGNASGTWEVNYRLVGSDTGELVASTAIETGTGDGTDGWKTFEDDFTGNLSWELADPTEYVYVEIEPVTTASNAIVVPTGSDNSDSWTNNAGSTTDIHLAVDEGATPDDNTYIVSPIIGTSGTSVYVAEFEAEEPYYHASATVEDCIKVRWKKLQAGGQLSWRLLQGTTLIASGNIGTSAAQATYTTTNLDLTAAEWNSITDFTDLKFELTFTGGEPGGSIVSVDVLPATVTDTGTWYSSAGGDATVANINANGGTYAASGDVGLGSSTQSPLEVAFADYTYPGFDSGHTFKIDTDVDDSGATVSNLKLYAGGNIIHNDDVAFPTTEATQTVTLDATDVSKMRANSTDLSMELAGLAENEDYSIKVDFARFAVPEPMQVYVSNIYFDFAPRAFVAVSWVQLETPTGDTTIIDDLPTIYAGDKHTLYTVDLGPGGFTDVSKSGGYATGTEKPRAWQFTQWGNDVIATNYIDPVQIRADSTGDFADMITSTKTPDARLVTVVRDQVWLGDTTGEAEASADGVWWSAIDDATDFDPSVTTQCDYQRLRQTPGQVMGLVGGEYAIIFKRDSIFRADYEGPPYIYSFKLLSTNEGTPFPRSIVPVERDVFFHTGGEFLVLKQGEGIQRIQPPTVNKYFDDKFAFPATALFPAADQEMGKEDLAVFGAYDHHSNLIFWFLQNATYSQLATEVWSYGTHHNICAVFDVKHGRWSDLRLSDADLAYATALCSRMHWDYAGTHHNRSLVGFSYEPLATPSASYRLSLEGGTASAGNVFDKDDNDSFTIRIRYLYQGDLSDAVIGKKNSSGAGDAGWLLIDNNLTSGSFRVSDGVDQVEVEPDPFVDNAGNVELWVRLNRATNRLDWMKGSLDIQGNVDTSSVGSLSNSENLALAGFGIYDELVIWNRSLTDLEMRSGYGKPLPPDHDAAGYWKFDEGTGSTAADSVGSADFTLSGDYSWEAGGLEPSDLGQTAWTFSDGDTYAAEVKTAFFSPVESVVVTVTGVRPVFTFEPEGVDVTLGITLQASETPSIAGSSTVTSSLRDEDGWYNIQSLAGEFFSITAAIPSSSTLLAHELLGFEVRYSSEESR